MPWFRKGPTDEINNSEEKHGAIGIFDDSCILNYDYNFDANISNKVIIGVNGTFITLRKENYNFGLGDEETGNEFETREIINGKINIVEGGITCKSSKNGDNKESSNVLTIIKGYIEDEDDFLPIGDWSGEYYIKGGNGLRDETLGEEKKGKEIGKKEIWNLEYEDGSFVVKDAPGFDFESFSDEDMEQYNELIDENGGNWSNLNKFIIPLEENGLYLNHEGNIGIIPFEEVSYSELVDIILLPNTDSEPGNKEYDEKNKFLLALQRGISMGVATGLSIAKGGNIYINLPALMLMGYLGLHQGARNPELVINAETAVSREIDFATRGIGILINDLIGGNEIIYYNAEHIGKIADYVPDLKIREYIHNELINQDVLRYKDIKIELIPKDDGTWDINLYFSTGETITKNILAESARIMIEQNKGKELR